jgi:signal peptidase I
MQPNIESGNHVLISTIAYHFAIGPFTLASRSIGRGDVVAFERGQGDERKILLKRVIALPGETVTLRGGSVIVNGLPLREEYDPLPDGSTMAAVTVPAGTYFVLGDNRGESSDSRSFGPVNGSQVTGKALVIIWPLTHVKQIR